MKWMFWCFCYVVFQDEVNCSKQYNDRKTVAFISFRYYLNRCFRAILSYRVAFLLGCISVWMSHKSKKDIGHVCRLNELTCFLAGMQRASEDIWGETWCYLTEPQSIFFIWGILYNLANGRFRYAFYYCSSNTILLASLFKISTFSLNVSW